MSICHDRGDIFFGMVMVAVSPSLALGVKFQKVVHARRG
jgi:hypothetical protein